MSKWSTPKEPTGSLEWAVRGASVTGSEHERRGLGCDDAYSFGVAGDFVVAAVADGAGSVTGTSAWGSYTACKSILDDAMTSRFINDYCATPVAEREGWVRWLFEGAVQAVHQQAEVFGMPVSLLSTTLCVAVADRQAVVFGQIGDGIIATESDDQVKTLLIESKDEYANATWFIQSDGAFDTAYRSATHPGPTAFALSTDGMTYKITNVATGEAYQPFFRGSWKHVRTGASSASLKALLGNIEDDQTGDDKTMVLAALPGREDQFHPSAGPTQEISDQPPFPGSTTPVPLQDSPHATADSGNRDWVSAIPTSADASSVAAQPEPDTDELPSASTGKRKSWLPRGRER